VTDTGPGVELLPAGTPVDLTNCEREPIHVPGSIQPRGVLLAVTEPDLVVEQVSENLGDLVRVAPAEAVGRRLPEVLGVAAAGAVARSASAFGDLRERNPVELQRQLRLVRNLSSAAFHRHPKAWEWIFEDAASDADQASDLVRAQGLVRDGRKALARGDGGALRSITEQLLRLLPVDVQKRRLGHDSGVR